MRNRGDLSNRNLFQQLDTTLAIHQMSTIYTHTHGYYYNTTRGRSEDFSFGQKRKFIQTAAFIPSYPRPHTYTRNYIFVQFLRDIFVCAPHHR